MNIGDELFIIYPSAVHWKERGAAYDQKGKNAINQMLWGDWATIENIKGKWIQVTS